MQNRISYLNSTVIVNHHGPSDHISKKIINGNFYELGMLKYLASLNRSGVYVDVGANIGNHTLFFARFCNSSRVYAFEPYEKNYNILKKNVEENDLQKKILHYQLGIGKEDGMAVADVNTKNFGSTSLSRSESGTIEIKKPSHFFDKERISLLKIDAENMSYEIFEAFLPYIKRDSPVLIIEAEPDELKMITEKMGKRHSKQFNATPTFVFI
jgi:FkbM family methyltransferase